jgi:hypothetical protein
MDRPFDLVSLGLGDNREIIRSLQVQPEFWRRVEVTRQTKGRIGRDTAPSVDDLGHASGGHTKLQGQPVDTHPERLEKIFSYRFARMRKRNSLAFLSAHGLSFLVVVSDLNVKRVTLFPSKTDPILIVDSDAVLSGTITLQHLEAVRRRRCEVSKLLRAIDLYQSPERYGSDRLKSLHAALVENRLRIFIVKRSDQTNIILRIA